MDGIVWILSYFVLTLTVLWLTLAVIGLYRARVPQRLRPVEWPSTVMQPGEPVPACLRRAPNPAANAASTDKFESGLFVVVSEEDPLSYAAVATASALAHHYGLELVVAIGSAQTSTQTPAWLVDLDHSILEAAMLDASEYQELGLTCTPVLGAVLDDSLQHLVAGVLTPSDGRDHLDVFLSASDRLSPAEGSLL